VSEIWKFLSGQRGNQKVVSPQSQQIDDDVHRVDAEVTVTQSIPSNPDDAHTKLNAPSKNTNVKTAETSDITRKVVKKQMIQALKNAKTRSLTLKLLRKSILQDCQGGDRSLMKDLIQQNLDRKKYFLVEDKTITLKIE